MLTLFITKLMVFLLCVSALDIVREMYRFYVCYANATLYELTDKRMYGLWASISYIVTIIITGIL